jgi:hypothetical protein
MAFTRYTNDMIWKMVVAQVVAMAMLAIFVLMLRDLIRHRAAAPRHVWFFLLVPLAIMVWGLWLMVAESSKLLPTPP